MANFQELLKAQGLTDEQIGAIVEGMKQNKIYTASEANLDIRYGKLKGDYDGLNKQYGEAQALIEQMKQSNVGAEQYQAQIAQYKAQLEAKDKELKDVKVSEAIKVGLLEAKVNDIDYMTFKLKEKGEIELDENGKIKGWDDAIAGLKTQFPNHFEASGKRKVEPNKLETGDGNNVLTRDEILKKPYAERKRLFDENPEAYTEAMKNTKN